MRGDTAVFLLSALGLAVLIVAVETLHGAGRWSSVVGRRVVHVVVGLYAAVSPWIFAEPGYVMASAALFVPANLLATRRRWLSGMHGIDRQSDGTATFPLALLVAAWWCWFVEPGRTPILQASMLVLALADPVASIAGSHWGNSTRFRLGGDEKSLVGSASFMIVSFVSIAAILWVTDYPVGASTSGLVATAATAAVLATLAEALGRSGWDNFFMVLAVVVFLTLVSAFPAGDHRLGAAVLAGGVLALLTWRFRLLDPSGAVGAGLLAFTIVWLAGWEWLLPGGTFFVLSSGLSRLGRIRKSRPEVSAAKTGPRDFAQVAANGGVAWMVLVVSSVSAFFGTPAALAAFCGAFAAAAADTWATEIGGMSRTRPRLITTWQSVPAGMSGGVTPLGLVASIAGALSVAGAGWAIGAPFLPVLLAGMVGSLADSLIGATLQVRWTDRHGKVVEASPSESSPGESWRRTGVSWVTNDTVNLLCTITGAILAAVLS